MMIAMKKIEELVLNDKVWCADIRSDRLHKLYQTTISDVRDVKTIYTGVRTHLKIAVSDKAEFIIFRDSHYEHSKINVSNTLKIIVAVEINSRIIFKGNSQCLYRISKELKNL